MSQAIAINTNVYASSTNSGSFFSTLMKRVETAKQRRHLAKLTPTQLNDIGLTQHQVDVEVGKGFFS